MLHQPLEPAIELRAMARRIRTWPGGRWLERAIAVSLVCVMPIAAAAVRPLVAPWMAM